MPARRLLIVVILLIVVVTGCAEPTSSSGSTTTQGSPATTFDTGDVDDTTTTLRPIATTTTTVANPTTSTSFAVGPTESPPTSLVTGEAPELVLLTPVLSDVVRLDEIDNYYSFARNGGGTSVTTRFEMWEYSDLNVSGWSNVLRVDGRNQHLIFEVDDGGEVITTPGGTWSKNPDGQWEPIEDPGEFGLFLAFLASPDIAYGVAYLVFEDLEFVGWSDLDGSRQAVYRGGNEAGVAILDGFGVTSSEDSEATVEVVWSPDGYFTLVHVDAIDAGVTTTLRWVISDVGTTVVQAPR